MEVGPVFETVRLDFGLKLLRQLRAFVAEDLNERQVLQEKTRCRYVLCVPASVP